MKKGDLEQLKRLTTNSGFEDLQPLEFPEKERKSRLKGLANEWESNKFSFSQSDSETWVCEFGPESKPHRFEFVEVDGQWKLDKWESH